MGKQKIDPKGGVGQFPHGQKGDKNNTSSAAPSTKAKPHGKIAGDNRYGTGGTATGDLNRAG